MINHIKTVLNLMLFILLITTSCKKEFLAIKPDKALVIPNTLKDLQAIADNTSVMTGDQRNGITPLLGELGTDNYVYTDNTWINLNLIEKNSYIWAKEIFAPATIVSDWNKPYQAIFYANVILQGLENLSESGSQSYRDNLKGTALFYRAHALYHLLQIFAPQYQAATAGTSLGIPLPLNPAVQTNVRRATLAQSYAQLIQDLEQALPLLPEIPLYKTRPCKSAVNGLLSRVYLIIGNYNQALAYANAYLEKQGTVLDFNTITLSAGRPVPSLTNPELTFYSVMNSYASTEPPTTLVNPVLYTLYPANDLRRDAFFKVTGQQISFKLGNYTNGFTYFSGIATGEILLIRAECYARNNNKDLALQDLNKLRQNRIAAISYTAAQAATADQALDLILLERRLELCFRGLSWPDLRRLNKEPRFAVTLTRTVSGNTYTLPPNDPRYVYPIPATETDYNPLEQNIR
ncbi:hypothetical protein HDC92_000599 [Pedobacter sp. AK017]|uniref:RagB/SusD family nutrient uptake outer membrane protein n=1 Tax=Pedobacter sp. AK017 TaxID=2723073 RepID=UPI00161738E0|nr:RagB/SusD family nutrient uptake outer membrane protein [Pedobacter sp. AK017]MBB5436935.1 hypothetical protein [Pedobacter sp. AK017]